MGSEVFDLHCDTILKIKLLGKQLSRDNREMHVDIPKMRRGGVMGEVFALWVDSAILSGGQAFKEVESLLCLLKSEFDKNPNDIKLIIRPEGVGEAEKEGKISAIIGIEGGAAISNDLNNLTYFYDRGVRLMTLTHVKSLSWVGSSSDDGQKKGLNGFGKDVIHTMNDLGMIIDVAHVGEKSCLDVAGFSRKPIICSHSGARGVIDVKDRLCSNEMIQAIAETGGVIGVIMFPILFEGADPNAFGALAAKAEAEIKSRIISSTSTEERIRISEEVYQTLRPDSELPGIEGAMAHFDYIIDLVGEDHVAIGSDFDGISFVPKGLKDVSEFDTLRLLMKNRGYSEGRISKIMGGNVQRVISKIL